MTRTITIALLLLLAPTIASGDEAGRGAFRVPAGEVLLHRFDGGAILGALPGAEGSLLPGGVDLAAGTAVIAWSGDITVNDTVLSCDAARCQRAVGDPAPDAVRTLRRVLLQRRNLPLDLEGLRAELKKEEAAFTETGVVSVEAGSVCLDAAGADGGGGSGIETPQTRVEKTPATLRVKITFD